MNQRLCDRNYNTTAVFATWLRLLMVRSKAARKDVFPHVKNELNGCNGCKKCGGQMARMREVRGTCPRVPRVRYAHVTWPIHSLPNNVLMNVPSVTCILGQHKKPFTDGGVVKECMSKGAETLLEGKQRRAFWQNKPNAHVSIISHKENWNVNPPLPVYFHHFDFKCSPSFPWRD